MSDPREHYGVNTGWSQFQTGGGSEPGCFNPMTWLTGLILLALVAGLFAVVPALGVVAAITVIGFGVGLARRGVNDLRDLRRSIPLRMLVHDCGDCACHMNYVS